VRQISSEPLYVLGVHMYMCVCVCNVTDAYFVDNVEGRAAGNVVVAFGCVALRVLRRVHVIGDHNVPLLAQTSTCSPASWWYAAKDKFDVISNDADASAAAASLWCSFNIPLLSLSPWHIGANLGNACYLHIVRHGCTNRTGCLSAWFCGWQGVSV